MPRSKGYGRGSRSTPDGLSISGEPTVDGRRGFLSPTGWETPAPTVTRPIGLRHKERCPEVLAQALPLWTEIGAGAGRVNLDLACSADLRGPSTLATTSPGRVAMTLTRL